MINGINPNMVQAQQTQFEQFVQQALSHALTQLPAGYKPTAIFSRKEAAGIEQVIISGAPLEDVLLAITSAMKSNNIPMPAAVVSAIGGKPEAANDEQKADLHLAVINVVSVIRRVAPLLDGFAETHPATVVRKRLLEAVKAEGVSETARHVVAGYMSTVPGNTDAHPGDVETMLRRAENGEGEAAVVFYTNTELGKPQ